jgi:hypothetical protein
MQNETIENSGLVKSKDQLPGGPADDKEPSDFDSEQLRIGTKEEMEHTTDPDLAREIAMDHLAKNPHHYCNGKKQEVDTASKSQISHFHDSQTKRLTPQSESLVWKVKKARKLARRLKFQGMDISIETDKGQHRHWYDPHNGERGSTKMSHPYGYIRRTMGADDEHVDCYIGPDEDSDKAYVISQLKKPDFKDFDEHKVMLGFESKKHAKSAYLRHYNSPKFYGDMTILPIDEFKEKFINKALGQVMVMPEPTVEDMYGVQSFMRQVPTTNEGQLVDLAGEIWGKDYRYKGVDAEHIRAELIGFLLDQRDLLESTPQEPQDAPEPWLDQEPSISSETSNNGNLSEAKPSLEGNSYAEEYIQ